MDDRNTPNPAANRSKAEGDRWSSNADTVGKRDREQQGAQDRPEDASSGSEAGGITNRPLDEEDENQAAVPPRGESREGAHAGHGDNDRSER
jgi:hypothetical protein